ncbi:MAG: asparagine--tRNA ligase [Deltaproteobacteria bacterium]|nr:asparagine--tRNA ligase [Deltaproteobacteria bacterium]
MKQWKIKNLLACENAAGRIRVMGWVRTRRDSRGFSFLEINDGSCLANLQVIADDGLDGYEQVKKLTTGSAVAVEGALGQSPGKGQKWELAADRVEILQTAPNDYPLQKKRHSDEFLRTIAHLRPRTNKYGAAFRIRSALAFAVHAFFREKGFVCIHTPILTGSDCEGAGALFSATTLDPTNFSPAGNKDAFAGDFFGQKVNLTVSGQLSAEMFALSLGNVYTFGPAFRAENSNTRRHAAEFWMVEPEMAFCDLAGDMDNAEELIKYLISRAMIECKEDLSLFFKYVDKDLEKRLETILEKDFLRISYEEAVCLLEKSGADFKYDISWGKELQTEHERFLTDTHFKGPVIVYDYPADIKPFYMRVNDDGRTVAAMDVLMPGIGEIIGGSQREERLDILESRMKKTGIDTAPYWWYIDSRRFGSIVHSGYGLGFERLIMLVTGISNIRDVIAFPRTPGNIAF